ncbi:MAG: mechanosensitive ion channel [Acidobacteria bacterium]|nr:mechanosensitive ion channel [Acidobacteriota bacterium]
MKEKLYESFQGLVDMVAGAAPKVVLGILLLLIAIVVAKVVEKVLSLFLVRLRLDNLVQQAGLDRMLRSIGIRQKLDFFIPRLIYYLILCLLAKTLADSLELVAISNALGAFFSYLPNLIAAFLLVMLGSALSQFIGTTVRQAAENAGLDFAAGLGRLISGLVFFIVAVMAISQLKVDTEMLRLVTAIVLAAGALAFGISFGFGARDIVRNILAGFYVRKFLQTGKPIAIIGQHGTLQAITATHTILDSEEHSISISNATFLDQVGRQ